VTARDEADEYNPSLPDLQKLRLAATEKFILFYNGASKRLVDPQNEQQRKAKSLACQSLAFDFHLP
jgi:hypothetical protein